MTLVKVEMGLRLHDRVDAFIEFNRPALACAVPPPLLRPFSMQMLNQKYFAV